MFMRHFIPRLSALLLIAVSAFGADQTTGVQVKGTVTVTQGTASSLKVDLSGTSANATALKVDGSAVTQPISAASLPLPSTAATSTKQSDGSQKTQIVDGSGNVIGATSNRLDVNCASGCSSLTDLTGTGTLSSNGASVTLSTLGGRKYVTISLTSSSFLGTIKVQASNEASFSTGRTVSLPMYFGSGLMTVPVFSASDVNTEGIYVSPISGYNLVRVWVSAYTSGSLAVNMRAQDGAAPWFVAGSAVYDSAGTAIASSTTTPSSLAVGLVTRPVGITDSLGNAIPSETVAPFGAERGLIVRNIPTGVYGIGDSAGSPAVLTPSNPTGSEEGLVVRNIPSGTQNTNDVASSATGSAVSASALQIGGTDGTNLRGIKTDTSGYIQTASAGGTRATYSAAAASFASAASATDICTITGSGTKTIRVTQAWLAGTQTTAGTIQVFLEKRSTADTSGTAVAATVVPVDQGNAAGTATVNAYTGNPTTGSLVGHVRSNKLFIPAPATAAGEPIWLMDFGTRPSQAIVLRGTGQVLAFNLNSTTVSGSAMTCGFEWTEE
jgi:hypothetical protein